MIRADPTPTLPISAQSCYNHTVSPCSSGGGRGRVKLGVFRLPCQSSTLPAFRVGG